MRMNPLWLLPAVGGAFIVGLSADQGYFPNPVGCTPGMEGTFEWQFSPLDDEGYSEAYGELRRAGWTITHHDGSLIRAHCRGLTGVN